MGLRVRPRESPINPEAALPPPRSPSRPLHPPLASGAAPRALVAPAAPRATDEGAAASGAAGEARVTHGSRFCGCRVPGLAAELGP